MGFINEEKPGLRRTIDYERNAIMRQVKGAPEGFSHFQILWNDASIKFLAQINIIQESGKSPKVISKLHAFEIPPYMNERRQEIISMIEESLATYGWAGSSKNTDKAEVILHPSLER